MRLLITLLCGLLAACSRSDQDAAGIVQLPSEATAEERAFAAGLQRAFAQADPAQFVRLTHWKASEGQPPFHAEFYGALIARGCRTIRIERVDPQSATERMEQGTKVRESLPVRWVVTVIHPATYDSQTDMLAGLDDASIKITTTYAVKEEPNQSLDPTREARGSP